MSKPAKWDPVRIFGLLPTDPAGITKAELQRRAGLGPAYNARVATLLAHWARKHAAQLVKMEKHRGSWRRLITVEQLAEIYRPRNSTRERPQYEKPREPVLSYAMACLRVADLAALVQEQMQR